MKEKERKKKVRFANDVKFKKATKTSMMCSIYSESFLLFTKSMWIGDVGASCHITNNDTGFYDVTNINELVQSFLGCMSAIKS